MSWRKKKSTAPLQPNPGETAEASENPGGWVYFIAGEYGPNDAVPPEAIVGAWKAGDVGKILGEFIPSPMFKARA